MLAQDFVLGIALEPLSARIPTRDDPVRVEHVDGIIGDRIDQKLEASLLGRCAGPLHGVHQNSPADPGRLLLQSALRSINCNSFVRISFRRSLAIFPDQDVAPCSPGKANLIQEGLSSRTGMPPARIVSPVLRASSARSRRIITRPRPCEPVPVLPS